MESKKKKAGRPCDHGTRGRNFSVYLTESERDILDKIGRKVQPINGGVSVGIRALIKYFIEHAQQEIHK